MPDTAVVTCEVPLRLILPGRRPVAILVDLRFDSADPWAVRASFRAADDSEIVEWVFARQLLVDGLTAAAGLGDVAVRPAGDQGVHLSMSSPSGSALFEADRPPLADFLRRTLVAVPLGREADHVDLDAELTLLLSRG